MPQIEIRDVSLSYFTLKSETEALRDIRLNVENGEFISIVGPSGCGKSTLLSLISGMIKPIKGEVCLFGAPLKEASKRVGYMLQHDFLFEWPIDCYAACEDKLCIVMKQLALVEHD